MEHGEYGTRRRWNTEKIEHREHGTRRRVGHGEDGTQHIENIKHREDETWRR